MKSLMILGRLSALALVCLLAVHGALAERVFAFKLDRAKKTFFVMTVIDHPDPIGIRARDGRDRLERSVNPGGRVRGDGPAALGRGSNGYAVGVWAYRTGSGHDIAFSEFRDDRWTNPVFLTRGLVDEVDPKVHVKHDGTVYVVWWTPQDDQIFLATRPGGSTEWEITSVTAGTDRGRHPSVMMFYGQIRVIFDRPRASLGRDVIVATLHDNGSFGFDLVDPVTQSVALGYGADGQGILGFDRRNGGGSSSHWQHYSSTPETDAPQVPVDRSPGAVEEARQEHWRRR